MDDLSQVEPLHTEGANAAEEIGDAGVFGMSGSMNGSPNRHKQGQPYVASESSRQHATNSFGQNAEKRIPGRIVK